MYIAVLSSLLSLCCCCHCVVVVIVLLLSLCCCCCCLQLKGVFRQGLKCKDCSICVHKRCSKDIGSNCVGEVPSLNRVDSGEWSKRGRGDGEGRGVDMASFFFYSKGECEIFC